MKKYLVESENYGTIDWFTSYEEDTCLSFDCVKSWKELKEDPYEEVWDFVRLIYNEPEKGGMTLAEVIDCFGAEWPNIINKHTYEEAKKLYNTWKEKKDKELNVGDEVCDEHSNRIFVITRVYSDSEFIDCVKLETGMTATLNKSEVKKTGKHYPEIAKLFSK